MLQYVAVCCNSAITAFVDGYCSTVQGLLDWFEAGDEDEVGDD